jgi:predicted ATPase/DNA-binding CsgD family transcriptional regulator
MVGAGGWNDIPRMGDVVRRARVDHASMVDVDPAGTEPEVIANNLPEQLTSFVGRERDLRELHDALGSTRLLTLNGAGGCGKTRLALQLAADVLSRFPGGGWAVELASLTESDRVIVAVASALGEQDLSGDLLEVIVDRLSRRATLIVLDNCEHLLAPVATLVDVLLRRCALLTIVATSREPLGVPGETSWRVPSLDPNDAHELFLHRAARARPNFKVTREIEAAINTICERLDGIPLAIELAAARVRGMAVEQIAAALNDRFRLLTGGARTVMARQQTLQASVDWSYELLTDKERAVFRRLSVFAGGFTLDAAEAVVADDGIDAFDVLDVLLALVDKSMLVAEEQGPRYHLLETLRQYGAARLLEKDETTFVRDRHVAWAKALYDPLGDLPTGALITQWQLGPEVENMRAALTWAWDAGDTDAVRVIATGLMVWESNMGDAVDAAAIGRRALAMDGGDVRLWLLVAATLLFALFEVGDFETAGSTADLLLPRLEELDGADVSLRLYCMRMTAFTPTRIALSDEFTREGIKLAEEVGDVANRDLYLSMLAVRLSFMGDWRHAEGAAERIAGDRSGTVQGRNVVHASSMNTLLTGRFEECRAHLDYMQEHFGEGPMRHPRMVADQEALRMYLDLAQGRETGAFERVRLLIDDARRRGFLSGVAMVGSALGVWALGHNEIDVAVHEFEAWIAETGDLNIGGLWRLFYVSALLAAARVGDARVELERPQPGPSDARWPLRQSRVAGLYGLITRAEGDVASAERFFHEALAAQYEGGWRPDVVHSLEGLAGIASVNESFAECARLAGAGQSIRDELGYVLRWPYEQKLLDADLAAARAALGDEEFDAAFEEGRALDEDAAVAYAQRARGERKRPSTGWASLTPTERDVVRLVVEGLTNKQIGEKLFMSAETVKTHLSHVYDKLGVRSRTALASQAPSELRL